MPKKIRELKTILLKAGFVAESGKGSHSKWSHPKLSSKIIVAGKDGSDAKIYLEKQIATALEELKKLDAGEES